AVILALGTNDFSDKKRRPYHEEYVQAWTSLIRQVHAMNPEAPIICLEPLPAAVSPLAGLWIEEACQRAQREGIPAHYIALNADGPLLAPGDFVGDGTHPTKSGSARLARYLAPRLAPFLPHH
ncbi:MAG: GDSL-type esterase/lipase family protein, partial [Mitsuokella jalaludinii]|nr:GDSL-type esterase/lipase family protein [Mitsuokella jalaludinii]